MKTILDTNFLIYITKQKIADQLKQLGGELFVLDSVEKELKNPKLGNKDKIYAAAALRLLEKWEVKKLKDGFNDVDISILDAARKMKEGEGEIYVATLDEALVEKLRKNGIKILSIKKSKFILKES